MEVKITKAEAVLTEGDLLTTGMVGKTVSLVFSSDWDGLAKTAVFRTGEETRATILEKTTGAEIVRIPHEVLKVPERKLYMGVYGTDGTGSMVLPTVWCQLGTVQFGADPTGDETVEPTPSVWDQMRSLVEELEESKAPAGYGYGEAGKYIGSYASEAALFEALDTELAGMATYTTKLVTVMLAWYSSYYRVSAELYKERSKYAVVRLMSPQYKGSVAYASRQDSVWTPLMWMNPPMYAGVEYCTMERYDGHLVYAKLVAYSSTEAIYGEVDVAIPHGIAGLDVCISCDVVKGAYRFPIVSADMTGFTLVPTVNATGIVLRNKGMSWAAATWYFLLKYTKSS